MLFYFELLDLYFLFIFDRFLPADLTSQLSTANFSTQKFLLRNYNYTMKKNFIVLIILPQELVVRSPSKSEEVWKGLDYSITLSINLLLLTLFLKSACAIFSFSIYLSNF